MADTIPPGSDISQSYLVMARKYRPLTLDAMIGQDAMVRTLNNAIASGRLAHAYILTGVRGVGKTTTARILARGLNCTGPDGTGGPTANPCGVCDSCRAIAEDRHVDVIEMDAASRTGVNDIRELIEGVRYRPVSARYKIYIIDEVHMLSNNAFNALLKTLEEPPPHVKFIFATTEIRKVPVTVLSRCQRFDLRRVDADTLAQYFATLAEREGITIEPEALAMIARAADGSVRDGQSLLDQAFARSEGTVTAAQVQEMLGLADRGRVFDLLTHLLEGKIAEALKQLRDLYDSGADPATVMQDLLEITHSITRLKYLPDAAMDAGLPEAERKQGGALAQSLSLPVLARLWQMLLKGLQEVQAAPQPIQATEMVLIRLAHLSDQPTPGDLVKRLSQQEGSGAVAGSTPADATRSGANSSGSGGGAALRAVATAPMAMAPMPNRDAAPAVAQPQPQDFAAIIALAERNREMLLHASLEHHVHLVQFSVGHIALRLKPEAPRDLPNRLATCLRNWTGQRWVVSVSGEDGAPTVAEKKQADTESLKQSVRAHPLVQAVLQAFPGAEIQTVRPLALKQQETADDLMFDDDMPGDAS